MAQATSGPSPVVVNTPVAAPVKAKPAAKAKKRHHISIFPAWCKQCGICGAFCGTKAIVNDESGAPIVADEQKCVGCMQCVFRCPDFCIEVSETGAPADKGTSE
jgi:2-oxoglutarate ferredoxin oxidoreductase subunit delta